jgi:hypothetical protein
MTKKEIFIKNRFKNLNQRNQPYFAEWTNRVYQFGSSETVCKTGSKGKEIVVKQALASIGQPLLMRIFMKTLVI